MESWIARDGRSVLYPRLEVGDKGYRESSMKKNKLPQFHSFGIFPIHKFWCDGNFSKYISGIILRLITYDMIEKM